MRDILVKISPDSLATVQGEAGFVEEHNAARLVIELNEDLSASDISYHVICFDIYGLGRKIVSNSIYGNASDKPAFKSGNTLICPLPEVLTSTGELLVQVEAHKAAGGEVIRIVKSGMFTVQFEPSVTGCDDSLAEACGLLPRLQAALAGFETAGNSVIVCTPDDYHSLASKNPSTFYLVDDEKPPEEDDEPEPDIPVTGLTLNKSTVSICAGTTEVLAAAVSPDNATNKAVAWVSSNTAVATVNQNGLVTGVNAGSATISATSEDGNFMAFCTVTIASQAIAVTGVTLNKTNMSITRGASETLTAAITPANASNKSVAWASSNTAIATVAAGVITSVGLGTAIITVTTADGGFTSACAVTVTASLGLWQGTKTVNGITAVISGSHITLNGTKTTANYNTGTVYFTDNVTDVANSAACPSWNIFKAGDVISLVIKNKTGSCTESGPNLANACCQLRNTENVVLCGSTWGTPAGTFSYTFTADMAVTGLFSYLTAGAVLTNYAFDVEFSVNGVRWI